MPRQVDTPRIFKLLIEGALVQSESERTIDVTDRRDRMIAGVSRASSNDVQRAIDAARAAQPSWAYRDAFDRGRILYNLAQAVDDDGDDLAEAIAATTESTPAAARREVEAAVDRLAGFAGCCQGNHPPGRPL